MPIIGSGQIQAEPAKERGILIDREGFFVARVEWQSGRQPLVNRKETPRADRRRLLKIADHPNAANVPGEFARWDSVALDWIAPTDELTVIDEATGDLLKTFMGFKDRLPDLPAGAAVVDNPPPKRGGPHKSIFDKAKGEWAIARRVALIDPDGVIDAIVLENPNDTTPGVVVPEGWSRIDDRDPSWPLKGANGAAVGVGAKRNGDTWERPAPEPQNG